MRAHLPALFLCLAALFFAPHSPAQTTRNVGTGQTYPTIQSGIDAANPGDTVLIAPGTYFENINFHGKAITVTSSGGPSVTILDGSQHGPAVTLTSGEPRSAVLSNLTVQHGGGFVYPYASAGLRIYNSSPTIQNNIFTQNDCQTLDVEVAAPLIQNNVISATQNPPGQCSFAGGAGIYISENLNFSKGTNDGSAALIIGNDIENNVESGLEDAGGNGGAAIAVWGGSPVIMGNTLRDNASPGGSGGAVNVQYGHGVSIVQNLIYGNFAGCGGGAIAVQADPGAITGITALIANNTLVDNTSSDNAGFSECITIAQIYPSPELYGDSSPATVFTNNIIDGGTPYPAVDCAWVGPPSLADQPTFSSNLLRNTAGPFFGSYCIDVSAQDNNITADPQFLNPTTYDLHLQPTSPAIGHGDPSVLATFHTLTGLTLSTDFDGNPRETLNGSACSIDMGAYQHTGPTPTPCGSTETLTSSANPSTLGQAVIFTAQISGTNGTPSGNVQFSDGTTLLATEPTSSTGAATFSTAALAAGSHSITAVYQPAAGGPGTTATIMQVVNGYPTTLTLTSSLNPATVGQSVTFTVALSSPDGTPNGTITLADNGTTIAFYQTIGSATYTSSRLAVGSHNITATYSPSATFAGSSASLTQVITGQPSTISLAASPNPVAAFGTLTLTSTVSGTSSTIPTGTVTFTAGSLTLGHAPVGSNGASVLVTAAPAPGTYSIVATYSGDATFQSATSSPVTETVLAASSATTLTTSPNPAYQGQTVSLSASVAGVAAHVPTGSVSFFDAATLLGSAPISASGSAALTTSSLTPGVHLLTATYSGDATYTGSTSPPVQQVILPSSFSIALAPTALTLRSGQSGNVLISLSAIGDFSGPLTLTTGALPTYAAGGISPSTVTLPAGGTGNATLALTTVTAPQLTRSDSRPGSTTTLLATFFGLLLLPRSRLRRLRLMGPLSIFLLAALLGGTSGCGGDIRYPFHTVAAGTYQIPVTATDAAGNAHSATLTLTVTP